MNLSAFLREYSRRVNVRGRPARSTTRGRAAQGQIFYRLKNREINKIKSLAAHPYKVSVSKRGARFSVPGLACHVHLNRLSSRGNK